MLAHGHEYAYVGHGMGLWCGQAGWQQGDGGSSGGGGGGGGAAAVLVDVRKLTGCTVALMLGKRAATGRAYRPRDARVGPV